MSVVETDRVAALRDAESKAVQLFDEAVRRGLVVPGITERQLSDEIRDLANEMFGVRKFWHKRIVRSGVNTLEPYRSNPAELTLESDDIVFFDFGPIFSEWEADVGRTYVLGDDEHKHRLAADLPVIWAAGRDHFAATPEITGDELFAYVLGLMGERGWGHGARHAGHLVGEFPHERVEDDQVTSYITPGSHQPMRRPDAAGNPCHWILEVHLTDRERGFGGFFEQLLDL
ncbi:M24 family metallopeptidase [Microlunatus antarcticus]|uniref:Xaa-Pro aminopeptidase n=1 Tax=Microlunatus antarcticus TaxID=53388 RepID=A0A7W5JT89_9ACTN|nr:M24 family metallopeptidase [Microlunatus antarcticus]MBB3325277.1 Xaa-Pro aminopeptidase [Microlunatus antarcticus]